MENTIKLFIDMDGTLAEWRTDGLPHIYEKGYYETLKPLKSVETVKLLSNFYEVYVLSAVLPDSPYAGKEKKAWIKKYLPEIPEDHVIFSKDGGSKREFVKSQFGKISKEMVLVDDYSINLDDWSKEGTSIKFLNGFNGKRGRTYDFSIKESDSPLVNAAKLDGILYSILVA